MPGEVTPSPLDRWRREVRRALPNTDADIVEEVAQDIADRWARVAETHGDGAADRQAWDDLAAWQRQPAPSRRARWELRSLWRGWPGDVRYAARVLRLRPAFAIGAWLLTTLAVAAVVCSFAIAYGILWRPLPYPDPDRLAVLWQVHDGRESQISYPDYADLAALDVFEGAAAMAGGRGSLRAGDGVERVNALSIEAPGLAVLGATPHLGRLLTAADGGQPLAMLSHRAWASHFAADPAVVGRPIWLSGRDYTIVGVLRDGFDFELPVGSFFTLERHDVWSVLGRDEFGMMRRDVSSFEALVRLAPGRTLAEAQAAVDAAGARLAREHPSTNDGRTFRVASLAAEVSAPVRRPLLFVLAAAALTLVVALANLAILGLARRVERQAELSIRDALGAGVFRLRRQLITENACLALCGAAAGIALASVVTRWLTSNEAAHLPRSADIRLDLPILAMAAAVTLVVTVVLGAQPLNAQPTTLRVGTRSIGAAARRSRRLLVAVEVALALTLATAGALLALSVARVLAVDPGFDPSRAAAARVSTYAARQPAKDDVVRLFDELRDRLEAMPSIAAAGAGSSLPLSGQTSSAGVLAEGRPVPPAGRLAAGWQFITPGYLEAAGLRLVAGRDFADVDRERDRHVTIVNQSLARALFGPADPLGRRIGVGGDDGGGDWHEIVGVVRDVRHHALDAAPTPRVYDLFGQHWGRTLYVVARSRSDDEATLPGLIRRTVQALDPEAPVFEAATLPALVHRSAAARRLASAVAAGLAGLAMLLAFIGVYAVSGASVAERSREIGVRAALGASPRDLFRMIAREGASTAAMGGLAGVTLSLVAIRLLRSQLFGVAERDALWMVPAVAAGVLAAVVLAALPAAHRAATADPLLAIKE